MERSTSCFWFSSTNPQFSLTVSLDGVSVWAEACASSWVCVLRIEFLLLRLILVLLVSHVKPLHQYSSIYPHPHLPHPPASGQSHWRALTLCGCLDCTTDSKVGVSIKISVWSSFWWTKTPAKALKDQQMTWRSDFLFNHLTPKGASVLLLYILSGFSLAFETIFWHIGCVRDQRG